MTLESVETLSKSFIIVINFIVKSITNQHLIRKECNWRNSVEQNHILQEDDPEVKKSVTMATWSSDEPKSTLDERAARFSCWYRSQLAVALCMKYVKRLKARTKKEPNETAKLKVQDVERVGKLIICATQFKAFQDQLKEVPDKEEDATRHKTSRTHNSILPLGPFIDKDSILRVGGRLKNASLSNQVKHPIILPKGSHVTKLIIKHYEEHTKHQGQGMTLNETRSHGYWIIGLLEAHPLRALP